MKILLQAYLNNNLGDDLMIDFVCKRYPEHEFYIPNTNCLKKVACYADNLHIIRSILPTKDQKTLRFCNKILSFFKIPKIQLLLYFLDHTYDVNLELGGSIFMQVTPRSWINKIRDSNVIINHCKYNIIVGCNFGPFYKKQFLTKHRELFKRYDYITFREYHSYHLFSIYKNIYVYPDIVFNTKFADIIPKKNVIGISVISFENAGIKNFTKYYIDGMVAIVNKLTLNCNVILMAFCKNEGDEDSCIVIKEKCLRKDAISVFTHENIEKSKELIITFKAMICTRFHANILALTLGIPFVSVIYSNKIRYMLEDISYKGYSWDIMNGKEANIENIINQLYKVPKFDYTKIKDSQGHIKCLDRILKNGSNF